MLKGYLLSGTKAEAVTGLADVDRFFSDPAATMWLDVVAPESAEMEALGARFGFDPETIEDCLTGEQRTRVDEFDAYVFFVFYGVVGDEDPTVLSPRKVAAYCNERYVITVHRESLRTIAELHDRCHRNAGTFLKRGSSHLLFLILDGIVDRFLALAQRSAERIDALEDRSLGTNVEKGILSEISESRRDLIELRNLAVAQRDLIVPIARGEFRFSSDDELRHFAHVADHITTALDIVNALREQLLSVRENYSAVLSDRMNNIMKTLTVFATILLPLGLIAGVYGMNLPLWPPPESPYALWFVLGGMAAVVIGMIVFFRRQKWL